MDNAKSTGHPNLKGIRLALRKDLRSSLQQSSGQSFILLEDPIAAKFFRIGIREWQFVKLLDGTRTLDESIREYHSSERANSLSVEDMESLQKWVLQCGLAKAEKTGTSPTRKNTLPWWSNPLFIRIPLLNPDKLLTHALRYLGWSIAKPAVWVWAGVCMLGLLTILWNQARFTNSLGNVVALDNWIYLLVTWIGLKMIHEIYHGIICKRFGGHVPRCGIVLFLFSPLAFVDVTSSWRFRSRWHRIYTSAGGIYAEFFIAAMAALVWAATPTGTMNHICHSIIVMAGISTLIFNGNFLMKFDGYYILADLLEIQNLYGTGQHYIRFLIRKYWLNVPAKMPRMAPGKEKIIRLYAFASLIWRWMFCIGILVISASMFHGAGIILASAAGILWLLVPGIRFSRYILFGSGAEQPDRRRFWSVSAGAALISCVLLLLPWPGGIVAPGVIDYAPLSILEADTPGFVRKILVQPGQQVQQGDPLIVMENREITLRLRDLELQIQQAKKRSRSLLNNGFIAENHDEKLRLEQLVSERQEISKRADALTVRAEMAGRILGSDLDSLQGRFFEQGDFLLAIGDEKRKEVKVSIHQDDVKFFLNEKFEAPYVRTQGGHALLQVERPQVAPKASTQVPHVALTAPFGGPLTVISPSTGKHDYQLTSPRFAGSIKISPNRARNLPAGQVAMVRTKATGRTIGQFAYGFVSRWLQSKSTGN